MPLEDRVGAISSDDELENKKDWAFDTSGKWKVVAQN